LDYPHVVELSQPTSPQLQTIFTGNEEIVMNQQRTWAFPQNTISDPSNFLALRLRDDSNLEMEWQWAAGQVTNVQEQIYCLRRVLYINPENTEAYRQFEMLTRSMKKSVTTSPAPRPSGIVTRLLERLLDGVAARLMPDFEFHSFE
jgi:hypothetical protein